MKAIVVDNAYNALKPDELRVIGDAYEAAGIEYAQGHFPTEESLIENCQGYDIVICTGNPPFTRKVMEALPDLKVIHRTGAGVNSIDLDAATELGKIVIYLPGFCTNELADNALGLILGLVRNIGYYDRAIRAGRWPKNEYFMPPDVRDMTLGLFGFGLAGRELARIMHTAYGTEVIACDPYVSDQVKADFSYVSFVDFETLLKESDIISIHVILTLETTHVFDRAAFEKMKDTAMIINTSRGPVIDQQALYWALTNGIIRYAGLDTLEKEPADPDDPLLQLDNVIIMPHCGSYGQGAKRTQRRMMCDILPMAVRTGEIEARVVANKAILARNDLVFGFRF